MGGLPVLHKVRCSDFCHLLPRHSHTNIAVKPSFDFYSSSSWFAGVPFKFASGTYNMPGYQWSNNLHNFRCPWCSGAHPLDPVSCLAFCPRLDDHLQAFIRAWPAPFTSVVQHWWITCSSKADKRNFARTLVPTSLWSALQAPIPGLTASAHRMELDSALVKRRSALKESFYGVHDWFRDNPQPWDPINWAHPLTSKNPWRIPHGPYSTSTPSTTPPSHPRSQYAPPPLPTKVSPPPPPPPERHQKSAKQAATLQAHISEKTPGWLQAPTRLAALICTPPPSSPTCGTASSLPHPLARRLQGPQKRTSSPLPRASKQQRANVHSATARFPSSSENLRQTRLPFVLSPRRTSPPLHPLRQFPPISVSFFALPLPFTQPPTPFPLSTPLPLINFPAPQRNPQCPHLSPLRLIPPTRHLFPLFSSRQLTVRATHSTSSLFNPVCY